MGQITDKAASAYRDFATQDVPASGPNDPSKADIRDLFKVIDVAIAAVNTGIAIVSTTAQRDTFYATEANRQKLVYVNNNNGSATDAANGVYEYVAGSARVAQSFYAGLATVVQPLISQAQDAASQAAASAAAVSVALPSLNAQLADLRALIAQVALSVPVPGTFRAQDVFINNTGQSLGEGSNGALTTAQQFNSVGFAWCAESPTAYLPLTIANTQAVNPGVTSPGAAAPNRGESPMYGAARYINELKNARNFPTQAATDLRLVLTNNAVSSQSLDYFAKGTPNYAAVMSQVTAGKNISAAAGRTFKYGGTFWTQGENEYPTVAQYRDELIQLAVDTNADTKAITGQTEDSLLFCYQTPTAQKSGLAQLQAHIQSPLVVMVTPIYQLDYYDSRHITAASSQILGAYYGYAYWWQEITKRTWEPTRPRAVRRVSAKVVEVDYYAMVGPLVFDTAIMPAQSNMGFLLVDSTDNDGPFGTLTVEIVGEKTVRVTVAGSIPDGSMVTYGRVTIAGKPNVLGYGGNLRDSAGASLKFDVKDGAGNVVVSQYPLHNWGVLSSDPVPAL